MLCAIIALAVGFLNLCIVQLEFIEYKDDATCVVLGQYQNLITKNSN